MDVSALYADKRVTLTPETLRFSWYYFPCGSKTLRLADIERIEVFPISATFNLRAWGSGDFRTWSPLAGRNSGRFAYLVARRGKWSRIAFAVADDEAFQSALQKAGLEIQPGDREYFAQAARRTGTFIMLALCLGPLIAGIAVVVAYLQQHR